MRDLCQYPAPIAMQRPSYNLCASSCYIYNEQQLFYNNTVGKAHYFRVGYPKKMVVVDATTKLSPSTRAEVFLSSGKDKLKLTFSENI